MKWPSFENFLSYKKPLQFFKKKAKKTYFEKATENGIMGSKTFCSTFKTFLSSKEFIHNDNISTEIDSKINEDESESAKQSKLARKVSKKEIAPTAIDKFKNHTGILSLKNFQLLQN